MNFREKKQIVHRNFQEQDEGTDELTNESDIICNEIDRLTLCERELKNENEEKYDNMLQLKPIVEKIIQREKDRLKELK